jgi:hypothetical protein
MRETWYVLESGKTADPNEVAPDENGVLRHAGGEAVAIGPHGPRSRSVDPDEERAAAEPPKKEMTPEQPKRGYKTREIKGR